MKEALTRAPVLRCADPALPYEITTDASEMGIGGVLTQTDETGCRPVAFASTRLNPTEQGYPTHEREHLAIICEFANMETIFAWVIICDKY